MRLGPILLVLGAATGCANDHDPWFVRPPGGGGTTGGSDAGEVDARPDGGTAELHGTICVIDDLRFPSACLATSAREGVLVRIAGTETTARTDASGRFVIATPIAAPTFDVADDSEALMPTRLAIRSSPGALQVPIITAATWTAIGDAVAIEATDGLGAIVAYVDDGTGPAAGVVFDNVAGAAEPFYDHGGALAWEPTVGTGSAGVAMFRNVPTGSQTLTAYDASENVLQLAGVSVGENRVTVVRATFAE